MSLPPGAPKNTTASLLSDAEYRQNTDTLLTHIEACCDRWLQDDLIDIDSQRTGGLLELSFPNGSKIVVNTQPPLHELWLTDPGGNLVEIYARLSHEELAAMPADQEPTLLVGR
jgi:frataxin-like iron-binding protein CyaY